VLHASAAPVVVSDASAKSLAPDVAVDRQGGIHLVWLQRMPAAPTSAPGASHDRHLSSMDLWYSQSSDGGATFTAPIRVNDTPGSVWGFAVSKPKVAVARSGVVHVVYPSNDLNPANGKAALTMRYTRSRDRGRSFEGARRLHEIPVIDQSAYVDGGFTTAHAFGALGVAPNGKVYTVWVDTRHMKPGDAGGAAYLAVSSDDGQTFQAERSVFDADVCPCCQLTLAFDAASNVFLGSRLITSAGERNSSVARMESASQRVGVRTTVGMTPWKLEGCPLKPTVVAVDGRRVYAAAYNGAAKPAGVYLAASSDRGESFAAAVALHPDAAVSDAPTVAVARGGVLVAWHAKTDASTRRVFYRVVSRGGRDMTGVAELDAPPGLAQSPAAAVRADGAVQLAWQQGDVIATRAISVVEPKRVARY
jgi:hypothetical protein